MKYFHQPIWTTQSDINICKGNVFNVYIFRNIDAYNMKWNLVVNGNVVEEGVISNLDVPAQSAKEYQIPFSSSEFTADDEVFLNVYFTLK